MACPYIVGKKHTICTREERLGTTRPISTNNNNKHNTKLYLFFRKHEICNGVMKWDVTNCSFLTFAMSVLTFNSAFNFGGQQRQRMVFGQINSFRTAIMLRVQMG